MCVFGMVALLLFRSTFASCCQPHSYQKELTRMRSKSDAPSRSPQVCCLEFRVGQGISGQAHWQMDSNAAEKGRPLPVWLQTSHVPQEDRGMWGWAWRCSALCQLDYCLSPSSLNSRRGGVLVTAEVPGPRTAPDVSQVPRTYLLNGLMAKRKNLSIPRG